MAVVLGVTHGLLVVYLVFRVLVDSTIGYGAPLTWYPRCWDGHLSVSKGEASL